MEQGNNVIYFRGTERHKSKNEGNRGTKVISGSREQKIKILILVNKGNAEIFQGNKGTDTPTPPLGWPCHTHQSNKAKCIS